MKNPNGIVKITGNRIGDLYYVVPKERDGKPCGNVSVAYSKNDVIKKCWQSIDSLRYVSVHRIWFEKTVVVVVVNCVYLKSHFCPINIFMLN